MFKVLDTKFEGWEKHGWFHENEPPNEAKSYFSFTVVRNPYARLISIWWRGTKAPNDKYGFIKRVGSINLRLFLEYIQDPENWHSPLLYPMYYQLRKVKIARAIKLENLQDEVKDLPFWNGRKIKLPIVGASQDGIPKWYEVLTPDDRTLIQQWAGEDFERFEYKT